MKKIALLIGSSEYSDPNLNSLPGAVNDVQAIQFVLQQLGEFDEVVPLVNPDKAQMEGAIETVFGDSHRNDLLLFYFSGHGIKDENGRFYFATHNTRKYALRSTAVPVNFIHEVLGESRSRQQIVILDCCYSGAFVEGMRTKDDQSVNIQGELRSEGRAVLTSSTANQYSLEQQEQRHSLYTQSLVSGIWSGEADQDQDGWITIQELHDYTKSKIREVSSAMKPEIYTDKEGNKIRLCRAHQVNPESLYAREVEDSVRRGEISFLSRSWINDMRDWLSVPQQSDVVISSVGRATLSAVQDRLGLTAEKAQSIQERVVQPYRQLHQRKQQYRKAFAKEFHYGKPISPLQRQGLKRLQYVSGLTDAEVSDIEEKFTRQFGWLISLRANNLFSIKSAQIILWAATFIAALVAVVSLMPLRNSQPESSVYPSQDPFVENFSEPSKQELLKEGKESLNLGDFEDAISKFEKIVKQDPGQIEAYSSLAEAHLNLGEINSVIEVCNQAINNNNFEDSKLFKLYHLRGISYYKLGESDKLRRLSNFERSQRDLSKAINITENQSLETFKDKQEFASLYIDRAYTLLALNDFQAAIEDFNKAIIDLDSNDPRAYEGRGDARKNKNQLKKAEQDFTQARNILGEQGDQTSYVRVQKKIDQLQKRGSN